MQRPCKRAPTPLPLAATLLAAILLSATLLAATPLPAQEVIELSLRDRHLDPAFEEVFRVGVLDGDPREMFATIPRVAFDARGNLYVFDRGPGLHSGDLRVVIFDGSGVFLRELGSVGDGPGEFRQPLSYAVLRDGTVVVGDIGHRSRRRTDDQDDHPPVRPAAGHPADRGGVQAEEG